MEINGWSLESIKLDKNLIYKFNKDVGDWLIREVVSYHGESGSWKTDQIRLWAQKLGFETSELMLSDGNN